MGRVEERIAAGQLTAEELEHQALALKAIGALLLVFDAIPAVFIFVGIRDGSLLWLYWTAIEGLLGLALVAAGMRRGQTASLAMGHMVRPHLEAAGSEDERAA